jgi:toxin ParE1/3/4
MAQVELASEVIDEFERIIGHLARFDVADVSGRLDEIVQAVQILTHSPLIGRPVKGGMRELVIGRDALGYVALYRFVPRIDTMFVLAVRSQREAGFKREG